VDPRCRLRDGRPDRSAAWSIDGATRWPFGPGNQVIKTVRRAHRAGGMLRLAAVAAALAGTGSAGAQSGPQAVQQPAASASAAEAAAAAAATEAAAALPSWAELEAAGAVFGQVRILNREIFDTADPLESYRLFQWANALHIQTRPGVIERTLLFKPGDRVSVRQLDETERLLLGNRYLYEVQFRPAAYHDGVVDVDVLTRDTWSLDLGIRLSRSGGSNSSGLQIREYNLLGTGMAVSFGRSKDVDRSSNEFRVAHERAFGTLVSVDYSHATNSDGRSDAVSIVRPFYALDARWAAGVVASRYDRIDALYNAGEVVAEYRHRQDFAEAFGGWSPGLVEGWVHRYSLGLRTEEDVYATEPGRLAPAPLPTDQKLVGPFVRYELIEDHFQKAENRNLIGRPEFFALGLSSTVQLGLASTALGSSLNALLYSASIGRGFVPQAGQTVIASAQLAGQFSDGQVRRQQLGGQAQYYRPQGLRWLLYAAASADVLTHPDTHQTLLLGGDNGLRGYPLRYQSGTRRALFTLEERHYTDWYLWRLFRFGAAAFADVGRAWGGDNINIGNPGWLADVGFGLRIISSRAAFGNVLHLDVAFPLNTTPDIQRVQFLVTGKSSF
jgi:hypothetical protein